MLAFIPKALPDALAHLSGYEVDVLVEALRHRFDNRTLRIAHPDQYRTAATLFAKLTGVAKAAGVSAPAWEFYFSAGGPRRREPERTLGGEPVVSFYYFKAAEHPVAFSVIDIDMLMAGIQARYDHPKGKEQDASYEAAMIVFHKLLTSAAKVGITGDTWEKVFSS